MANTYTWKITQLAAKIHSDGLDNVIYSVQYNYIAKDNSDPVIQRSIMGSESVTYKEGDPFIPYNELTGEGNGFSFANYNAHELLYTIERAVALFRFQPHKWRNLVGHAMDLDFSWSSSSQQYLKIYRELQKS